MKYGWTYVVVDIGDSTHDQEGDYKVRESKVSELFKAEYSQ